MSYKQKSFFNMGGLTDSFLFWVGLALPFIAIFLSWLDLVDPFDIIIQSVMISFVMLILWVMRLNN